MGTRQADVLGTWTAQTSGQEVLRKAGGKEPSMYHISKSERSRYSRVLPAFPPVWVADTLGSWTKLVEA